MGEDGGKGKGKGGKGGGKGGAAHARQHWRRLAARLVELHLRLRMRRRPILRAAGLSTMRRSGPQKCTYVMRPWSLRTRCCYLAAS